MLNQIVAVGRLTANPELKELESGKKVANIILAVPRSFKNSLGEYETDFIPFTIWENVASSVCEYCEKGDLIGIKGRMQTRDGKIELIAEKVSYLSKRNNSQEEE